MTGVNKLLLLLVTLSAACMALPCSAAGTRDEVLLGASSIRVGDIFLSSGDKADVVIGPAPEPGKSIAYDASDLARVAKAVGLDWRPESNYTRTVITRDSESVSGDAIKDMVVDQLRTEDVNADL